MTDGLELTLFEDGAAGVVDYTGSSKQVRIPKEYQGRPVRYIAGDAFYGKQITHLLLPSTIQLIGPYQCSYAPYADENPDIPFSGLAGQPVFFVCEMGCQAVRSLVMEPSFQVELVDSLDGWLAQNAKIWLPNEE